MKKLIEILKDFNVTYKEHDLGPNDLGISFIEVVSDIAVLTIHNNGIEMIIFGYIENLDGTHTWVNLSDNRDNRAIVTLAIQSQVMMRTQA